ncbi:MAG: response regulator [Xanthomonadales bacterium]|nr:response regulator [Xanthomonadales bacterium]
MESIPQNSHLIDSVRAQAALRLKLGFPVLALILTAINVWGTSSPAIGMPEVVGLSIAYTLYNLTAWYMARHQRLLPARDQVLLTAIFDPIMLSAWLFVMGKASILFTSFYLFTILGFGFRIGILPMRVCQAVAMAGFCLVALYSPIWHNEAMSAVSHGLVLLIVPLYASTLIRNLHTARNLAESESKAKSQLLANVSHELRTPLTGIVSSAQLIASEHRDPSIHERVGAILDLSSALDGEIKQLLDLSKLQSGTVQSELTTFGLEAVTRHVRIALEPIALRKNIRLEIEHDARIDAPILGYEHELTSVLMNLAGNAVKFTDKGKVSVTVALIDDRPGEYSVSFRVADSGIGIPQEHLEKIFEPFYQVERGSNRRYGGTGLGTSIAYEHVRRMGGTLQVDSRVGEGTVFWFELRLKKSPHSLPRPVEAPRAVAAGPVSKRRILIADDHPVNLRLLQEMLLKDGHDVEAVHSGVEALECLAENDYDAIFLDFNMSDMDGAQVFQIYRFGKIKPSPTFFITADTSETTQRKLLATGAGGVIHKPITFHKLRTALVADPSDYPLAIGDSESPAPRQREPFPVQDVRSQLKVVPVEYISMEAIENLLEINSSRQFLEAMIGDAISDIDKLVEQLAASAALEDVDAIRHGAHSLKGVSLNVGAVRLASAASRLMSLPAPELRATRSQWLRETQELAVESVKALNALLESRIALDG